MATSSIFHNVILITQKEIEDFCKAIEECEKDPCVPPKGSMRIETDTKHPESFCYIFDCEDTDKCTQK